MLSVCLDKSDSVPLLLAIVRVVGEWLTLGTPAAASAAADHALVAAGAGAAGPASSALVASASAAAGAMRSPLTQKEKTVFLGRMCGFDRLPEVDAQPLLTLWLQARRRSWPSWNRRGTVVEPPLTLWLQARRHSLLSSRGVDL